MCVYENSLSLSQVAWLIALKEELHINVQFSRLLRFLLCVVLCVCENKGEKNENQEFICPNWISVSLFSHPTPTLTHTHTHTHTHTTGLLNPKPCHGFQGLCDLALPSSRTHASGTTLLVLCHVPARLSTFSSSRQTELFLADCFFVWPVALHS